MHSPSMGGGEVGTPNIVILSTELSKRERGGDLAPRSEERRLGSLS